MLDIGCGFGAFLARFRGDFESLSGIELASAAIETGSRRFPSIDFMQGSAERLDETPADSRRYDAIVYSDVIYYLDEAGKDRSLRWIAEHVADGGTALIAAWVPGGDYLTFDELEAV